MLFEPAAAAALAAAIFAAATAVYGHRVARSNARLQMDLNAATAKLQTSLTANVKLAEMRQAWIISLRDDMATFQSLGVTPGLEHTNLQDFYRLGTRIELHMNPTDPEYENLHRCLYAFLEAKSVEEKFGANAAYVTVCQTILKTEWDVLKHEVKQLTV
jgi:hypothetical protein